MIGWVGTLISQICGQILYMICNMHCDVDSYMPGGVGMLPTDIEASRWSNIYIYICTKITLYAYKYMSVYNPHPNVLRNKVGLKACTKRIFQSF